MPRLKASAIRHCSRVRGPDVFCERCGARQAVERRESAASGSTFGRRLRSAVTGKTADGVSAPSDPSFLRLCLECRGYSCPNCWNNDVGLCQTCAPLAEPEIVALPDMRVAYETDSVIVDPWHAAYVPPVPGAEPMIMFDPEPEPEPVFVAEPEPVLVAEVEVEPEPVFVAEVEVEPEFVAVVEPEPEPVLVAEDEPEPELVAEVEPQPVLVAEDEPEQIGRAHV